VSLLEEDVGDAPLGAAGASPPGAVRLPQDRASPRRFALSMQSLLPRAYDAIVVVWLAVFHHVLGVKYRFAQIAFDEHYFLTEGWSVVKGQVPYRDFQEFKPPVIFFVNALGIKLFGIDGLGYRQFLSILSLAGFLALAVALLSRRTQRLLVVAALMLMVNHFYDGHLHDGAINNAETVALDFFMLGTGVLLTQTKWQRTQHVLGGIFLSLSPLSKEPMVFAVVAAWLSLLWLHRIESGRKGAAGRFALFTIAGAVGVALTWLVYMLATSSLSGFILQMKLNLAYSENYAYQLKRASRTPPAGAVAETFRQLAKTYVNVSHLAVFSPFFVALVALSEKRRLVALGALVTFAASLYGVSIGHAFFAHYFIIAMTGTFFCVALGAIVLDEFCQRRASRLRHPVAATCLGLALVMTLPRFNAERKNYRSYKAQPPPVPQSDIDLVLEHSSPGDKIWTTDDPLLYVFSDRESAFRGGIVLDEIIQYYPGETDAQRLSIIREGLTENRPKLVVLGDTQVRPARKKRYMRALVMPFLRDGKYIRLNDRFYLRPD
jgi:hypothetical protein